MTEIIDEETITKLKKMFNKKRLPDSELYTVIDFPFGNRCSKYHLVKENNTNNYLFLIKRVANYYKQNMKDTNNTYNIWETPSTLQNIQKNIREIRTFIKQDLLIDSFVLKIYHICVPIDPKAGKCVYYFKELVKIDGRLDIDYIESLDSDSNKSKSNTHNCDFTTDYEIYGEYPFPSF